jgi:hypothetical protein
MGISFGTLADLGGARYSLVFISLGNQGAASVHFLSLFANQPLPKMRRFAAEIWDAKGLACPTQDYETPRCG